MPKNTTVSDSADKQQRESNKEHLRRLVKDGGPHTGGTKIPNRGGSKASSQPYRRQMGGK